MRKNQWPEDDVDDLRNMAGSKTVGEIAEWLGRSKSAVVNKASKMGIRLMLHGSRHHKALYSDNVRLKVVNLHLDGWTFKDIAMMLGMATSMTAANIWYRHKKNEAASE